MPRKVNAGPTRRDERCCPMCGRTAVTGWRWREDAPVLVARTYRGRQRDGSAMVLHRPHGDAAAERRDPQWIATVRSLVAALCQRFQVHN